MLTRQERRTQKKVLEQRNEARTEVDAQRAEIERLKGDVKVLAAEEIRRIEKDFNERTQAIIGERDKAVREREALLKDFEGALTAKLEETRAELESTKAKLANAEALVVKLGHNCTTLQYELDEANIMAQTGNKVIERQAEELKAAKLEDNKSLRKRLQAKTERCAELERENEQLKKAPKPEMVAGPPVALQSLLNRSLRQRLKMDAPGERAPEPEAPAAPAETPTTP